MKKLLSAFCLLPLFIFAQTGSIKGNVFYKQNPSGAPLADAGSRVKLISKSNKNFKQEATVDLQGNYIFKDLPADDYLVIISSRNTKMTPTNSFGQLKMFGESFLYQFCDSLTELLTSPQAEAVSNARKAYFDYSILKKNNPRKEEKMREEVYDMIQAFYNSISKTIADRLEVSYSSFNIQFERAKISDREIALVTDVGKWGF